MYAVSHIKFHISVILFLGSLFCLFGLFCVFPFQNQTALITWAKYLNTVKRKIRILKCDYLSQLNCIDKKQKTPPSSSITFLLKRFYLDKHRNKLLFCLQENKPRKVRILLTTQNSAWPRVVS